MKRFAILLSLAVMVLALVAAAEAPKDPSAAVKKKYIIHLKDGGKLQTDNYTLIGGKVRIMVPAGAISLDKSEIRSIEEIQSEDGATMQKALVPSPPAPERSREKAAPKSEQPRVSPAEPTDDLGRTEGWWKARVAEWQKKLDNAEKRYQDAQVEWNKYNGLLSATSTTGPGAISDFQSKQYQDLRGAARVKMDAAQADIDAAKQMLDETLPNEARKSGAPPGWLR